MALETNEAHGCTETTREYARKLMEMQQAQRQQKREEDSRNQQTQE